MNSHSLVAMRPSVPGRDCYWLTIFQRDLISTTYHGCRHLIHLRSQIRKDVSKLGFLTKILPLSHVEAITEKYIYISTASHVPLQIMGQSSRWTPIQALD